MANQANPAWPARTSVTQFVTVIIDSNGNVQQCTTPGQTGASQPNPWAATIGATTGDGTAQWTCLAVLGLPAAPTTIAGLPPPSFIDDQDGLDPELVVADMVAAFQAEAQRTLYPAQVEMLLINLYAYREALIRALIQWVGMQSLLAFSVYPNLDYLGQLLGVNRLASQPAVTTIEFTLLNVLTVELTVAAGTLVGTTDGQFQFATDSDLVIAAGATNGSVNATATVAGPGGNGYLAGMIDVQLSPNALIASASNTSTSTGGSAPETDDHLRTRIQAAPNEFSTAGPSGAYRFFALGVDPSIVDVQVASPAPGNVSVYVLTGPIITQPAAAPNNQGIANSALLAKVQAALSADTVRPLTDTVAALAVTEIDYQIEGTVELYADADVDSSTAAYNTAATQYAIDMASRVQRDIVPEEIIAALTVPGVYRVTLSAPAYTQLTVGQWANCTAINLNQTTSTESS